jgi:hypothetical protein
VGLNYLSQGIISPSLLLKQLPPVFSTTLAAAILRATVLSKMEEPDFEGSCAHQYEYYKNSWGMPA